MEVVGGAPQYNQKGKVGPTCVAVYLSVYLSVYQLLILCVFDVQVFIFSVDKNMLQVVSEVSGKEVRSHLALASSIQNNGIFITLRVCLCVCLCSWDLISAPVCVLLI